MSGREPSIEEMIRWIRELDDPYKVWLFGMLNAIFSYGYVVTGHWVDPDSVAELIGGAFVQSLGNKTIILVWSYIAQPFFWIVCIVQLGISAYAIYRSGKIAIFVGLASFLGWLGLFFTATENWSQDFTFLALGVVIVSALIARYNSHLDFDDSGRAVID